MDWNLIEPQDLTNHSFQDIKGAKEHVTWHRWDEVYNIQNVANKLQGKKEGSIAINVETYLTKFSLWTLFESWFKHIEMF